MKIIAQPNFPEAQGLSHYLNSVQAGQPTDIRTPFYGGRDVERDTILRSWMDILLSVDMPEELLKLEQSQVPKVGPSSIRLSWPERRHSLEQYYEDHTFQPHDPSLGRATELLYSLLPKGRLRPVSLDNVYRRSAKSTNWGLPYFERGTRRGQDYLALAKKDLLNGSLTTYPSVIGWRGQPNGTDKPKQRVVWMFPHNVTLIESMFQQALLVALRPKPEFAAWNDLDHIDVVVSEIMSAAYARGLTLVSYDATSYDTSVSRELIQIAFGALKHWFQSSYSDMLDLLEINFSESGIVTPDGLHEGRNGSVPSGSGLTNLVDSLVHLLQYFYVQERLGAPQDSYMTCLGDDGLWAIPGLEKPETLSELVGELGFTANPSKQVFSKTEASYLQRIHLVDYRDDQGISRGLRSTIRALNGMMSHERFANGWTGFHESIRWIMQLENCKWHPAFEQFVKWTQNGDKLRLGSDLEGGVEELARRAGGVTNIEEVLRIRGFGFTDRKVGGLLNFETVKMLS